MKQNSFQSKSHKSRKTQSQEPVKPEPQLAAVGGIPPSALVPATATLPVPSNDIRNDYPAESDNRQPQALAPEKQSWYRPPDSKARKLCSKIVVHRAAGRSDAEIAKLLKTTEASVRQYVYIGRKNGWLEVDGDELVEVDLESELAYNIDAKIVRNIGASLDGQMTNWQTHEMTMAAAKGRGIFKDHSKTEGMSNAPTVVAIQVVMPPIGASDQKMEIPEGMVGGVPAYLDGEVADVGNEPKLESTETQSAIARVSEVRS